MESLQGKKMQVSFLMEQHKPNFTKSEHKIYDYIVSNREKVLYYSLTELSEACRVAEATVLRFFKKLGFKGFQEFKFSYAQEVADTSTDDSDRTYAGKIKNNIIQAIENTHDIVDMDVLNTVIDKIDATDDLLIFGVGASGIAGMDMQNRLMRIGKHATVITDPHAQVMRASTARENTVVVAMSLTGSTKDIVDSVKIAKEKNATVIAITNYIKSPLTKYSDHVLLMSAKESPLDSGSLVSKITQLYVIDLICTGLTMKNYESAEKIKMEIAENIASKLY